MEKQTIIIGGITILLAVILFGALGTYIGDISDDNELYEVEENINYSSDFLPTTLENTLSPVGEGITSETVQVYNSTWLEFDGVDDKVEVPDSNDFDLDSNLDLSISLWFKTNVSYAGEDGMMVQRREGNVRVSVYVNGDDKIYCGFNNATWGESSYSGGASGKYLDDKWHHLVCVYDRDGNVESYFDGEAGTSFNSIVGIGNMSMNSVLKIGQQTLGSAENFNGSLDNIIFFNKVLTPNEISLLYSYGSNNPYNSFSINTTSLSVKRARPWQSSSGGLYGFTTAGNEVQESLDNGVTWTRIFNLSHSSRMTWVDSAGTIFSSEDTTGKLFASVGNSTNWTEVLDLDCDDGYDYIWSMTETNNTGHLLLGEYSQGDMSEKCANIYRSVDGGLNWDIIYNDSSITNISSNWGGRHIHNVKFNEYNNCTYASVGDSDSTSKIIKSCDDGITWSIIKNDSTGRSNVIAMEFTPNYRFFGEDQSQQTPTSGIIRTSDDVNFETVYTCEGDYLQCDFYSSSQDNEGNIYFGSFAQIGYKPVLVGSPDEGETWFVLADYPEKVGGAGGISSMSNFNDDGYAYYDNASISFRFYGLDLTDDIFHIKLNENTNITAYDSSGNGNNGTITGATWNDDGVDITLTEDVDYTLSGDTLTAEDNYLYNYLETEWDYTTKESFGFHVTIIKLIAGFASLIVLVFLIVKIKEIYSDIN